MTIRPLLLVLFVLTISSCEKTFEIPIPEESNKLVLNLLMNKDSIMMARVTVSGRLSDMQAGPDITNAEVKLYENGTYKETLTPYLHSGRMFYRGNTLPQTGVTYRVTAAVHGYKEVSGSDKIPDTAKVGEMKLTVSQLNTWTSRATINVQLHDDPEVQNYYRIRLYYINEWVDANGNGGRQKLQQYFEAGEADLPLFNEDVKGEFYTTDELFNGRSPRFIFRANIGSNYKKMVVEITSLTYNSYNYLNSTFMAMEKNDEGLAEKVIVYNNIENGLGIIGGVAQREYELAK